ncbi:Protein CBG14217 [Caenorhabditis briggsae]|uniref:Uncharacterized protein n=2 Tax=Caenorhabditis briggsae TaxID=6238 RepID=A0AAE9JRD6_CAEBR|nr:Protein CBG14217 [Caenorhabditis briggsae]ULT81790.1 hypothetical protein L3Y34_011633 [Caenorhabditis briggsae]UMM41096.1 hypothetical protein L5515_017512 [Caenorhabditis briggsae]CAP32817.2 Protein CBG14217 [Caenorhabditis briggsae]
MSRPGTRSSGQGLLQPPDATEGNVTKVVTILLQRLENIGRWKVKKMADELLRDAEKATTKELQNLWYITIDRKNGDPAALVDVGDRRPHSDRQPATPEDLTHAQWFFEAVLSVFQKEINRRQHFFPTSAEFRSQFPTTPRSLSIPELFSIAKEFSPEGYNGGYEFLED